MPRPWLSVVMPTYNGSQYLARALDSVVEQAGGDIELIAVDDGSTDGTVEVLASYAARLPLQIVQHQHVGNWAANSNHGLRLAQGRYACFLHQDDFWLPNRLRTLRALLAQAPDAALVLHPVWFVDAHDRRLGRWRCPLHAAQLGLPPDVVVPRLLVQNFIGMPAPTFPRELALGVGGFDDTLWFTPDWDLWLKLASSGPTVYHGEPLAAFRIHPDSQTSLRTRGIEGLRHQLEIVQERHFDAWIRGRSPDRCLVAAARFSTELTLALAALAHRLRPDWIRLARASLALGPAAWHRFWRDSRIIERVGARLPLAASMFGLAGS